MTKPGSPPFHGELRRGPLSAEHYEPAPRRISRAVARTSASLSRVPKQSQCCAFAALPTSGNAQSIPVVERHASTVEASGPNLAISLPLSAFHPPRSASLPRRAFAPGCLGTRPLGSIPLLKASPFRPIFQEVFSRAVNALQSWRACAKRTADTGKITARILNS